MQAPHALGGTSPGHTWTWDFSLGVPGRTFLLFKPPPLWFSEAVALGKECAL